MPSSFARSLSLSSSIYVIDAIRSDAEEHIGRQADKKMTSLDFISMLSVHIHVRVHKALSFFFFSFSFWFL